MAKFNEEHGYYEESPVDFLARYVTGGGPKITVEKDKRKVTSVAFEPHVLALIDEYAKNAGCPRNMIVELLINAGIRATKEQIEKNEEQQQKELEFLESQEVTK